MKELNIFHLRHGIASHENQYILMGQNITNKELPDGWRNKLSDLLGSEWTIWDRSTRIEFFPPAGIRSETTDNQINNAVQSLIEADKQFIPISPNESS